VITVDVPDELGALQSSLKVMQNYLSSQHDKMSNALAENTRVKLALDNVSTGVMIADTDRNIIYMNKSIERTLTAAESDIRKALPNFSVNKVVGTNIDSFHKNPSHQKNLLEYAGYL
jgi:methyl-accepting chemotaxis protein